MSATFSFVAFKTRNLLFTMEEKIQLDLSTFYQSERAETNQDVPA